MSKVTNNHTIRVKTEHKGTGETNTFASIRKASEAINESPMQISRILRGERKNNTDYHITRDNDLEGYSEVMALISQAYENEINADDISFLEGYVKGYLEGIKVRK